MDLDASGWLHLLTRWFHVVVGVLWIGQTYLFGWMDCNLEALPEGERDERVEGRLWMIHSGGFYKVEKQRLVPEALPGTLHWFKWEAALTWISGVVLLVLVYYLGGALVEVGSGVTTATAVLIGLGTLVVGWIAYDALWMSPLARHEKLTTWVSFALIVGVAWGLSSVLSGRAAYIHVGALFGTVMAANVWARILPGQRQLVAATAAGTPADATLAARAKQRSKHNTFLSVPLLFLMISSHFPTQSYGHRWSWAMLGGFVLLGWGARRLMTVLR